MSTSPSPSDQMPPQDSETRFRSVVAEDGRYPLAAYAFLYRGLERTAEALHGEREEAEPRHVSGADLCYGLRELAREEYGLLASAVLTSWNIRKTRDFGEMVFLLIEHEFMRRREEDLIEDFDDVFDIKTAFADYEISLKRFDQRRPPKRKSSQSEE